MRFGFVLSFSVALLACSSPDNTEEDPCGPNGECPTGFTCDSRTTKCVKNGTTPDARQADAKPSSDATRSRSSGTGAPKPAAAPSGHLSSRA